MNRTAVTSRRLLLGAVAALAGTAVALRQVPGLLRLWRKPTPYDDILARLDDRDAATELGRRTFASMRNFGAGPAALLLRSRLKGRTLANLLRSELSRSRTVEVGGWVLPESLVLICALAARA
jgi:hypothetical protein